MLREAAASRSPRGNLPEQVLAMPCLRVPRNGSRRASWSTAPRPMRPRGPSVLSVAAGPRAARPAATPVGELLGGLACVAVVVALVCAACGGSGRPTARVPLLQPTPDATLSAVVSGRATLVPPIAASPSAETELAQAPPA